MSALLTSHLEQISLCATSISELSFPGPRIFTNALLSRDHDITALIRDTEQYERALFHLAPPPLPGGTHGSAVEVTSDSANANAAGAASRRRTTRYEPRQPRARAVAAVLGGDLFQRTRRPDVGDRQKGDVDVELLLRGAEKLIAVYPVAGAGERIAQQRRRFQQLTANIAHYEARVEEQARELQGMNHPAGYGQHGPADDLDQEDVEDLVEPTTNLALSQEDLEREAEQIQELERKKKVLEDRVQGLDLDLGGLMR